MSLSKSSVPNIKSIPFTQTTIILGFLLLALAGIFGYLYAMDDIKALIKRDPEAYYQSFSSSDVASFSNTNSATNNIGCTIANLSNNHNSSPLSNGDQRFACYDGTYYYCSANSENKWTQKGVIQVQYGERRGDFVCGDSWDFNQTDTDSQGVGQPFESSQGWDNIDTLQLNQFPTPQQTGIDNSWDNRTVGSDGVTE